MSIHIGHHFFGAGNVGDDFMLAGFLCAVPPRYAGRITCAVPHDREKLARAFPKIKWLPYTIEARQRAIAEADVWLGLGGSPFQSAVSRWFVDHLAEEQALCAAEKKRVFFLGVGGQDAAAYALPEIAAVVRAAERIWTRDGRTAAALEEIAPGKAVAGADLAHIFFAENPPPRAKAGCLTATINLNYEDWAQSPMAKSVVQLLSPAPASDESRGEGFCDVLRPTERVWLAQESRALPGAERALFDSLPPAVRTGWRLELAEASTAQGAIAGWPSGQWALSSRYHATLVSAWAGSRTVILATNEKLLAAAAETGFPAIDISGPPAAAGGSVDAPEALADQLAELFARAAPPPPARLAEQARRARDAVSEFFASI